jgi:segregation and condensation protein B
MMAEKMVQKIIEALLFVSSEPISTEDLRQALDGMDENTVREAIEGLREEYVRQERSFGIAELAGGYQIVTNPEFAPWINKLFKRDETKLSNPALETLAIIAYKQPLTRGEIEGIRGVNVDGVIKTLLDKNLIKVRGRKDAPGRPITYGTTDEFLKRFGLKGLEHLPRLRDFTTQDLDFEKEDKRIKIAIEEPKGDEGKIPEKNTEGPEAPEQKTEGPVAPEQSAEGPEARETKEVDSNAADQQST